MGSSFIHLIRTDSNEFFLMCSHQIKSILLLGRKAMTNLDTILKSWDLTLLTRVCIVKVKLKVAQSCPTLCNPIYSSSNSPGQNTAVGSLSLLQGIFPTQGSNPGLSHCRWILYQLSHKQSPIILEWVAYPFSSRSSQPRNRTRVSCTAGEFFTNWAIRVIPVVMCGCESWTIKKAEHWSFQIVML